MLKNGNVKLFNPSEDGNEVTLGALYSMPDGGELIDEE